MNKYKKQYDKLIQFRLINKISKNDCYCESHHIKPIKLGGIDDESNLVNLLPEEHFKAHVYLCQYLKSINDIESYNKMLPVPIMMAGNHRYGLNTIIMTNTNLILLNKEKASSPISEEYTSPVTSLKKRFYKSSNEYQYNFIVFNTDIDEICATQEPSNIENVETSDETYKIYSIRYDASSDNFLEPKLLVSRTKSDSCENYKKDLSILKE